MQETKLRYHVPADLGKLRFQVQQQVADILESKQYTKGEHAHELASEVARTTGYDYGIPFGQATHAIFILARWYRELGFRRIWCPAFTWPSTYLPFQWLGYQTHFLDIDPETWLVDFGDIKLGADDLAVPVDTFGSVHELDGGNSSDVVPWIDSAQSLGAKWGNTEVNRIVSLSGSKIVTSGEGGVLLTQLKELRDFAESIAGWFSRITEMNAILGLAYISKLHEILEKKREIAFAYEKTFGDLGNGSVQFQKIPISSNHYIVAGLVDGPMNVILQNSDVEFRRYYDTVVNETNVRTPMADLDSLPNTKSVAQRILAFPSWPDMELERIKGIKV